jgi:hypothetical protein
MRAATKAQEWADFIAPPPALIGNCKLATMATLGEDLAPVWNSLVARVNANPRDAAAFLDLSTIAFIQHRPKDRDVLRAEAFALTRVYRQAAGPSSDVTRVLVFCAAGDYLPNMPIEFLLAGSSVNLDMVYVAQGQPLPASLPEHDVAFVALAESAENQPLLAELAVALEKWPRPVLNRPERIAPLTRDGTWSLLKAAPGLVIPINARVTRGQMERAGLGSLPIEDLLGGATFPIIARPLDSHLGDGLRKLDDAAAIPDYLRERPEPEFHIAPFIDYRSLDGLFRKYRVALVDGVPYAVHMAVSQHWMINYINADMAMSADKRAEEARFMADFDRDFALRHADALHAIAERTKLDYLPFDCAETADGQLLLFELGTNMIVHMMDPVDVFPYKRPQMEKISGALQALLKRASGRPRTVTPSR